MFNVFLVNFHPWLGGDDGCKGRHLKSPHQYQAICVSLHLVRRALVPARAAGLAEGAVDAVAAAERERAAGVGAGAGGRARGASQPVLAADLGHPRRGKSGWVGGIVPFKFIPSPGN